MKQGRAVRTEDRLCCPHIEIDMRVVLGHRSPGAFELFDPNPDFGNALVILEPGIIVTGHYD